MDEAPMTGKRETVSIMQASELAGVSRRTIYNWIGASRVEYVRTAGGGIRIFADTLFRPAVVGEIKSQYTCKQPR